MRYLGALAVLMLELAGLAGLAVKGGAQERTTATYEDWVVECQTTGSPPRQTCDMAQLTLAPGKNAPFSRVAIERPKTGSPLKLVVQVPVNVATTTNVVIRTSDADPGLAAPFTRCAPEGCFAEFIVGDEALKKLRTAVGEGKLSFDDALGRQVVIPLSFKGFSQAYDALSRLPKE
jgi:invasion protein IalB